MDTPSGSKLSVDEPTASLIPKFHRQYSQTSQNQLNRVLVLINPERLMQSNEPFYEQLEQQRRRMRYYRYIFVILAIILAGFLLTCVILIFKGNIEFKTAYDRTRTRIMGGTSF